MLPLRRNLAALAASLAAACAAHAHEFWLMPSAFHTEADSLLRVEMRHGERFAGDLVPRNAAQIARYELLMNGEATDVRGLHGQASGLLRPQMPGHGIIVYESREYLNELDAPRFEAYLREEGLDAIVAWRRMNHRTEEPGREAYTRCAKSLVTIGAADTGPSDRAVGLPCEIVLVEAAPGAGTARVLFGGEPLEGARVVLASAADPTALVELESDEDGLVSFAPTGAGVWMLTSLHMERQVERDDVDWKSYWASLTFEIPARDGAG